MIALFSLVTAARASTYDVRIEFPRPNATCSIELTGRASSPLGAFYDVTTLSVPGLARGARSSRAGFGRAVLLRPIGVLRAFDSAIGFLLKDEGSSEVREMVRAARAVVRARRTGRVFRVLLDAFDANGGHAEPQTLLVVSPDATYPRAVVLGWVRNHAVWATPESDALERWTALVALATVDDGPDHPARPRFRADSPEITPN